MSFEPQSALRLRKETEAAIQDGETGGCQIQATHLCTAIRRRRDRFRPTHSAALRAGYLNGAR